MEGDVSMVVEVMQWPVLIHAAPVHMEGDVSNGIQHLQFIQLCVAEFIWKENVSNGIHSFDADHELCRHTGDVTTLKGVSNGI
jgi:hypothetical protein